jgi:molecular chaperone GrpE
MSTENSPEVPQLTEEPQEAMELTSELSDQLSEELDEAQLAASLKELVESPPTGETAQPEAPTDDSAALQEALAKIAVLTAENDQLKKQFEEARDQYRRLYADFDNFRKRVERDKEELEAKLTGKFLEKFLLVLDDFERAEAQIVPKSDGEALIHRSYQSVYRQFQKCIKDAGLVRMETVGQVFDPHYHEAIAQEPSTEYDANIVSAELRAGYLIGDRVLRHALVKVSSERVSPPTENLSTEG